MKIKCLVSWAAMAALATSCVDKNLDANKDVKIGTVKVGTATIYIGKTDTFRISEFIPNDNEYLKVVDGKYTIYMQDTLVQDLPNIEPFEVNVAGESHKSTFNIASLSIDAMSPITINLTIPGSVTMNQSWTPTSLIPMQNPLGNNDTVMTIPLDIPVPKSNVADIDTIFFSDGTQKSQMFFAVDFSDVATKASNRTYTDSILLTVAFSSQIKISDAAGDKGKVQPGDTIYELKYERCNKDRVCNGTGIDTFRFNIDHYVVGVTGNVKTSYSISMKYKFRYDPSDASTTANVSVTMASVLTPHDIAITTQDNMPISFERLAYEVKSDRIEIPKEIRSMDSVFLAEPENKLIVTFDTSKFPFRFSDHIGGTDPTTGIDSGRIKITFPNEIRFVNLPTDRTDRAESIIRADSLFKYPNLEVRRFDTYEIFKNETEAVKDTSYTDSIIMPATTVFLKSMKLRKTQIADWQVSGNEPTIEVGLQADMLVDKIVGTFDISEHTGDMHQSFNIGDLLSSLGNIDTLEVGLKDAAVRLGITNPTEIDFTLPLIIHTWHNGEKDNSDTTELHAAPKSNETPILDSILLTNIVGGANLLYDIDSLTFDLAPNGRLENQTLVLREVTEPLKVSYTLNVPDILGGLKIVFMDTVDLGGDISDVTKGVKEGKLELMLDCENTLPIDLDLDVIALDSADNDISSSDVTANVNGRIAAAPEGTGVKTTPVTLTLGQVKEGGLGKLRKIRIRASLNGSGNGNLKNTDYVLISIKLKTDNIEVDVDKMMD
jgi:hypothetical protein